MKKCVDCGKTRFLTRHHIYPKSETSKNDELNFTEHLRVPLCRECHDKKHCIVYTKEMMERIIKRAKRRIKLEKSRLEFAEYQLEKLSS